MASQTAMYIFSSVYKFSAEGVAEVVKRFESTAEGGDTICTYDHDTETFSFECDQTSGERKFFAFQDLVTEYIEEEELRQEDVFENPKIERIDATSDQPVEWVDPRGLIQLEDHEDNPPYGTNQSNHYGNVCSRNWRPKQAPSNITEKLAPAVVAALSKLTDCVFYIDQDKGEVNVTGSTEGLLDRAEVKLANLEREMLQQGLGSKSAHLVETEKEVEFVLRFLTLRKLGRTLRTTLVEHGFQYIADLHNFYVVRLLKLDTQSQQYLIPKTKVQPVDLMAGASTLPRLWDDFLFKGIGDHSHNPLAGIEGSELATVLSGEVLQDPGTTVRKAEMVNQWVQGGSLDVLNPFMPIQEVSSVDISSNGKTGGSATSSALGDTSRFVASTSFETQEPNRPPSPRKRFGKVRKPKGGKVTQSLEGKDFLPEDIAATRVTNQGVGLNEELQPGPRVVEEVLSGMNQTEEAGHVEESRVESEPDTDRKNSQSIHLPPEILPPFTSPATAETVQDSSPDQVPVWEKQHAHAAVVGRLVDVSAPSTKSQDVEEPPGYKQSLIPNRVGSSEFTGRQPDRLPDVSEDEYPALPSRSVEMKTRPSLVDTPILPLRTKTRTLRIVQHPGSMPDSSLAADSVTSKSETGKPLKETLQEPNEVESRKFKYTMNQQKPAPKKEKSRNANAGKEIEAPKADKARLWKLNSIAESMLEGALYFRGEIKLEVQIGRILINSVPTQFRKMPFTIEDWSAIFATRNVPERPSTTFTNMLTTSSRDAVFIRDLIASGGARMFDEHAPGYKIMYEFICLTKEGDEIKVVIDGTAQYQVQKRAVTLGSIHWYYPKRTWDAKATLTGIPYIKDAHEEAVRALVDNLYIPDGKPLLDILTKTIGKELRIHSVTLHRQTRHICVSRPSIALCITEVQDLYIQRLADSTNLIRASAKSPAEMIRDNRLWYEISLSSSLVEEKFKENVGLELGDIARWTPKEIVEAGVMDDLSAVTKEIVTRIDGVGYSNKGPRGGPSDADLTTASTTNAEEAPGFW